MVISRLRAKTRTESSSNYSLSLKPVPSFRRVSYVMGSRDLIVTLVNSSLRSVQRYGEYHNLCMTAPSLRDFANPISPFVSRYCAELALGSN